MSAQRAKKKRIGSRRWVGTQNMTSEADEFHQLGSTTVAEHCIPEENTEPLNVSANPDNSQLETQNTPSPKLSESRRKLGSSRRHKLQHVKNSAAESYPKPTEDVEEKNRGYETHKSTQLSLAMQPHRKEEYSEVTEQQTSATHNSSLYSAITPDYSFQVQNSIGTNYLESDLESLIPKSEHLLAGQDENDMEVIPNSCKLVGTMLEETDKSDVLLSEKVNEKSHLVGISDLTTLSELSCPTVGLHNQLIDQSDSTEMLGEEFCNVSSGAEKESKENDKNTELLKQDGNLQGNYLLSKSHQLVVEQFSTIPEVTTDNSSPRKNTELECNVEKEIFSTPNEKLPEDEEQNRHISFQVKDAQHSEDPVNTVHEPKAKAKEIHANNHSSGSVTNDAAGKYEITFGNLIDQPEVNDTYQTDLILTSADDSATKQEDSNPGEQNVPPTKVSSSAALEHANDDHDTYDTKNLQISATQRVDTAPGQVYKTDGQVGDDLNPCIERTAYLEKEVLFFETEENESSMQSEIQACFDSHSQQTDTNFNPTGNIRKQESSSRNEGGQHAEDFVAESYHGPTGAAVEDARDNNSLETTSLTTDTVVQEKSVKTMLEGIDTFHIAQTGTLVDMSTFNTSSIHLHSTVVNLSNSTEMPEELPNMYPVTEKESKEGDEDTDLPRQGGNLQDNYVVSVSHLKSEDTESSFTLDISTEKHRISEHTEPECNVEQAIVSSTKEGMPTSEGHSDMFNLSEIKGSYQLEDAVHIFDKQDIKATQMNEIDQTDFSSGKDSESSFQNLLSETNASLDCQPQASYVRKEEQTQKGINPIERRREMRSSLRNKGQQQIKESIAESHDGHKEVLVNTRGDEVVGAVKRTSQEKLCQESEHGIAMPTTHDSSLYSAIMPSYSSEVQNPTTTNYPADLKCSISKMRNFQEDHNEGDSAFEVEVSKTERQNKSETFENQGVRVDHHSKDAINNVHEKEVKPTHEIDCFSQNMACDDIANSEIISGNLLNQSEVSDTYQYELRVEHADYVTKEEASYPDDSHDAHPTEENHFKALDQAKEEYYVYDANKLQISSIEREDTAQGQECEGQVEDNIKPSAEQTIHQEKEQFFSEMGESNSSLQSLQSEEQACFDFQPKQKDTGFNFMGYRRKLGSSRRNKNFVAELYHRDEEDIVENTGDNEPPEAKIPLLTTETNVQEKSMETTFEQVDIFTTAQTADVSDQVKENVHGGTLVGISKHSTSSLHSSPEEIVNEVHEEAVKPTQMQEMHQTDFLCNKKNDPSVPTLQSESNAPLNCQPQENFVRIEEQTHTGLNPIRNRRKLGSSRRNKGCLHVKESVTEPKEEFMENSSGDEGPNTQKMLLATKTMRKNDSSLEWGKQTNTDLKPTQETRKNTAISNDEKNTEQILQEGTILSQNVMDNSKTVKTDATSNTGKDDEEINEVKKNTIKDPGNLSQLTGYDGVKIDFIQSPEDDPDVEDISYHDCNVTARSNTLDPLEQEDANQVQTTEALSYGNNSPGEEMNVQQTNDAIETVRDVAIKGHDTESWRSIQVFGQDEEHFQDPTERDYEVIKASQEITHAELFSVVHNSKDTSGQYGLEEDFRVAPAVDVHEKSGISTAMHECNNQQRIQVKTHLQNTENLQEKSKQNRRKMGSTHRSLLNRRPEKGINNEDEMKESESNMQADTKKVEQVKVVEVLPLTVSAELSENEHLKPSLNPLCEGQQETNEGSIVHNKGQRPQRSTSVLQSSTVLFPGQPASAKEEMVNPVTFDQVAGMMDSERNVDVDVEPSQLNDFTGTEMLGGRQRSLINPVQSSNTQDITSTTITGGSFVSLCETAQSTQNDEERLIQDQAFKSAEPPVVDVTQLEIVKSDVRGGEHKDAQVYIQELNNTSEGVLNKNAEMKNASPKLNSANRRRKMGSTRRNLRSRSKGEYLHQKQDGDNKATEVTKNVGDVKFESDSEQRKEKVFEKVKHSHTAHDVMSETASGRRKLGSHRRLHGHRRDVRSIIDGSSIKTTEEESLDQDKISEVDESDKNSSSNISTSNTGEHSMSVSEKTPVRVIPVQHPSAEMCHGQESKKTFSLVIPTGEAHRSNSYNVMIIGDSSVGKSSFMRRAQSGTFPLDLPPSVGLDCCMWTVEIDGKSVMLQLWDTAGQERYHSITRQIFYKAQAFLLMYDITSSQSFSAVSYWANCIQEGAAENVAILLLGNKCDLAERQIKTQEGEKLAEEYNFRFMECSAATGENVIESLETVAGMLSQKTDTREEITALHKEPQQKKSTRCC